MRVSLSSVSVLKESVFLSSYEIGVKTQKLLQVAAVLSSQCSFSVDVERSVESNCNYEM